MGRVKKNIMCSVEGCENPAVRSLARKLVEGLDTGLRFSGTGNRVYLCKEHYKVVKKQLKKARQLERWRWG